MTPAVRATLEAVLAGAVSGCDPRATVRAALTRPEAAALLAGRRAVIAAVGKASAAMATGARDVLGTATGVVVVPGPLAPGAVPAGLTVLRGSHPVPDARSEAAGRALLALAASVPSGGVLLALISGGASALVAVPRAGHSLAEQVAAVAEAAATGAPIHELNRIRSRTSAIKGGRLAAACPAPVLTVVSSDVPGDDPAVVGSGPTVPARPGDLVIVAAGLARLRQQAEVVARASGLTTAVEPADLVGDVEELAARIAAVTPPPGGLWIGGGEWTLTLGSRPGTGGRAQHLALLLARAWRGRTDRAALVAGSDGVDGTGPAAGAVIDGGTWAALGAAGVDGERALAGRDSGTALAAAGAQIVTGPTGINHADLVLVLDRGADGAHGADGVRGADGAGGARA